MEDLLLEALKHEALHLLSDEENLSHEEAESLAEKAANQLINSSTFTESLNEDILNAIDEER